MKAKILTAIVFAGALAAPAMASGTGGQSGGPIINLVHFFMQMFG